MIRHLSAIALALTLALAPYANAFPPAPYHEIYGTVRDQKGNPLTGEATVRIVGSSGAILGGPVDQTVTPGVNYSLKIPMDAGTQSQLYQSTAMRPAMPFTAEVIIGGISYLPIEVQGATLNIGVPGKRTRLDLTLGVDSDGDGLPDAWEQDVIGAIDGVDSLADVTPEGDSDSDGVSNFIEYIAGTYAFNGRVRFQLDIIDVREGLAHMRFLAVRGRSYTLRSSADLKEFTPTEFSINADGSDAGSVLSAGHTSYQDVYVAVEDLQPKHFRLHVE
jgi:hypothetical protein